MERKSIKSFSQEERGQALVPVLLTMAFMLLVGMIVGDAMLGAAGWNDDGQNHSNLGAQGNASRSTVVGYFWTGMGLAAIGIIVTAASAVMLIIKRGL